MLDVTAAGFFGKIPARADFVRSGLPVATTSAWDSWIAGAILGSQTAPAWRAAWMVAPVWRFALPSGQCGPAALLGLWMPSTDRAGRLFPLLIAAAGPDAAGAAAARTGATWLDAAEQAGRRAIAHDLSPDELAAALPPADALRQGRLPDLATSAMAGLWWTEGGPRVAATTLALDSMPDIVTFIAMIGAAGADAAGRR